MDKGKKRASSSTSKSIWRHLSIAECIGRGKEMKEVESQKDEEEGESKHFGRDKS